MSARRALAVSALSLLVPACLVLVTATGSATEASGEPAASTSARRNVAQTVHLVAWPQIVQPGGRVASGRTHHLYVLPAESAGSPWCQSNGLDSLRSSPKPDVDP